MSVLLIGPSCSFCAELYYSRVRLREISQWLRLNRAIQIQFVIMEISCKDTISQRQYDVFADNIACCDDKGCNKVERDFGDVVDNARVV